jgi:putative transposase
VLTLWELEQRLRDWLLDDYHRRVQKGQRKGPQERWEEEGFVPRMPESLEQLDWLLVQVARKRRVQQSGIAFEGYGSIDPTLAASVGEEVMIRYDPLDLGEIRVFFEDRFVCRAMCPELSGQTVSLKEMVAARQAQRRQLRGEIVEREALVKQSRKKTVKAKGAVSQEPEMEQGNGGESKVADLQIEQKEAAPSTKRLKRYRHE